MEDQGKIDYDPIKSEVEKVSVTKGIKSIFGFYKVTLVFKIFFSGQKDHFLAIFKKLKKVNFCPFVKP